LGRGVELDVDLETHHRVVRPQGLRIVDDGLCRPGVGDGAHARTSRPVAVVDSSGAFASNGPPQRWVSAASRAAPTLYSRSSLVAGARICMPVGRPSSSARPLGRDMPGTPARLAGIVAMSLRYMARGSSTFSPILNAVVGVVGDTRTSACSNAAAESGGDELRYCVAE